MQINTRNAALVAVGGLIVSGLGATSVAAAPGAPAVVRTATLDEDKIAKAIKKDLDKALHNAVKTSVTCPSGVPAKKGTKSACTAKIGSQPVVYKILQTSSDGDITYTRTKAILDLDKAQSVINGQLAKQLGGKWKTVCAPVGSERYYVIGVGKSFKCPVSGKNGDGDSQSGDIQIKVKDLQGNISWEAV